jgi:hypothetical protein
MTRVVILVLMTIVASATLASAREYVVDPSGAGDCTTISACVLSASPGDTISVSAGLYSENLSLLKALLVRGISGSGTTFVVGPNHSIGTVYIGTGGVRLSGFSISGGSYGIDVSAAAGTLQTTDCVIGETGLFHVRLPGPLVPTVLAARGQDKKPAPNIVIRQGAAPACKFTQFFVTDRYRRHVNLFRAFLTAQTAPKQLLA